jgi:hypothetical protein
MLPASLEPIQLHISAPLLPGVILIKASPCTPLHVLCRPAMSASTSRTSFSSFKSPRSPPTPPGSSMPFMRRKMLSESCISMKGMHFDGDDLRHDPRGWAIPPKHVRNGYVGIQRDSLRSWAWTRKVWLVLDDKWLYTCQREVESLISLVNLDRQSCSCLYRVQQAHMHSNSGRFVGSRK